MSQSGAAPSAALSTTRTLPTSAPSSTSSRPPRTAQSASAAPSRPPPSIDAPRKSNKRPRQRPPQLQGSWQPLLPSAGGQGRGCGHYVHGAPAPSSKVAALDIDGTVIRTLSGQPFAQNASDWEWCVYGSGEGGVVRKLRELHRKGFAILLISNQASPTSKLSSDFHRKLPVICRKLNIPLHAFAAFEFDQYRKSATGMWDAFVELFNGGIAVDYANSFYVGDAAGRATDHADTDRKFAFNNGLPFLTPEEFFDAAPKDENWTMWGWNPLAHEHILPDPTPLTRLSASPSSVLPIDLDSANSAPALVAAVPALGASDGPELVLLVGAPAAGKTTYYEEELRGKGFERMTYTTQKPPPALLDQLTSTLSAYYASLSPSTASPSQSITDIAPTSSTPGIASFTDSPFFPFPPPRFAIEAHFPSRFSRRALLTHLRHHFSPSRLPPSAPPLRISAAHLNATAPLDLAKHNAVFRACERGREEMLGLVGTAGHVAGRSEGLPDVKEFYKWEREWEEVKLEEGFDIVFPLHFRFHGPPDKLARWRRFLVDVMPGKAKKTGLVAMQGGGKAAEVGGSTGGAATGAGA
ncbi:hypothetical protein JCM8097_001757 [Rhodosporidiobolus ruineniae]